MLLLKSMMTFVELHADWERRWNIEFEPSKSYFIYMSLKHDIGKHPPLFMNDVLPYSTIY